MADIAFEPESARPGSAVTARAFGFPPAALVELIWETPTEERLMLGSGKVKSDGTATIPFVVPFDGAEGPRTVELCCSISEASACGAFAVAGVPPEITAP